MSGSVLGHFNSSLERCLRSRQLFERFYEAFLASSPEVRDKFGSTDVRKHRRKLQISFYVLVEHVAFSDPDSRVYLENLAADHGKHGRDIPPHLYDLWLDCLLRAVRQCDAQYSREVEDAWRAIMGAGISFLKARYDRPVGVAATPSLSA